MGMSDDRRLDVLRAIVEDYVATSEPVGSRALVERHALGVSPATIRNDMAALEDAGLHRAAAHLGGARPDRHGLPRVRRPPHDASSRCPPPEKRRDRHAPRGRRRPRRRRRPSVRLLAQLTHQVAVVQYPSLRRSALRHVELVPVGAAAPARRPHHRHGPGRAAHARASRDLDEVVVARLRVRLNVAVAGRRLAELDGRSSTTSRSSSRPTAWRSLRQVVAVVAETLAQESEERVVVAGTANLARSADATSRAPSAPCSRRSRSRSCSCGCCPRWRRTARRSRCGSATRPSTTGSSDEHRDQRVRRRERRVDRARRRHRADPHGLPRDHGVGARRGPLPHPHPRRVTRRTASPRPRRPSTSATTHTPTPRRPDRPTSPPGSEHTTS